MVWNLTLETLLRFQNYMIYPLSILVEASKAQVFISSLCLVAQLIGNHVNSGAFIYGSMSFLDKCSTGLAIFFIQGQTPSAGDPSGIYYPKVLVRWCGCLALVALALTASLIKSNVGQVRR